MNTPITDAAVFAPGMGQQSEELVNADLARQLERDRARLLEALETLMDELTDAPFDADEAYECWPAIEATLASLEIKESA